MEPVQIFVLILFIGALALISSEKIHRTIIAMLLGTFVIAAGLIHQADAIASIDFNTLGLLIGMMIIVSIAGKTGFFEFLAIHAVKRTHGHPMYILIVLSLLTALLSGLLDNVTTVLLIIPVTLLISSILRTSPVPFVISEIFFSNIGGAATLIGDPPNIIIGSAANISFVDFLVNMAPFILLITPFALGILYLFFRKELAGKKPPKSEIDKLDPNKALNDIELLKKSALVFAIVLVGFLLHAIIHLEAATIALFGASLLLLITVKEPHEVLEKVEWDTIFFFSGLFVLVGALEHTGVLNVIADEIIKITDGDQMKTSLLMLWFSGIASGFTDNIPITTVMVELIHEIARTGVDPWPLWWSLAIGADLGGNMTIIAASANIVGASLLARNKTPISFMTFLKYGVAITFVSLAFGTIYIYGRYFFFV